MPSPLVRLGARIDRLLRGDKARLTPDRAAYFCHDDWVAKAALRAARVALGADDPDAGRTGDDGGGLSGAGAAAAIETDCRMRRHCGCLGERLEPSLLVVTSPICGEFFLAFRRDT